MATSGYPTETTTLTDSELRAYSVAQVLDRVPIGRTKLYEEIREGRLRTCKIGTWTLVTAGALRDWLHRASNYNAPPPTGKRGS